MNTLAAIRSHVLESAEVTALVGARVYAGENLPAEYNPSAGPAILLNVRGGGMAYHNQTESPSVQYRLYAATLADAWSLYDALKAWLVDGVSGCVVSGRLETQGQQLTEPEVGWPYVLCGFRHHVRGA